MLPEKSRRMTTKEIEELLKLKGWSQRQLADELEVTEGAVSRWVAAGRVPRGPAAKWMRTWLTEARAKKQLATA
jgi:transcriptional regulator with XRE-family HTH domain